MKNYLPAFIIITITLLFSSNSFAQREAGGSSQGVSSNEPCPVYFKRNNGNGTCGGDAEIRLVFTQHPANAPVLIGIWYNGNQVPGIELPSYGDINQLEKKGYISYCLYGANIPAANKITLQFRYPNGQEDCWISE
jgi:hypothetical protein